MKKILFLLIAIFSLTAAIGQNYIEVKTSELPKKITAYFTKNFKSYSIDRSVKSIEKGVLKYAIVTESHGRKAVYIFDKNGTFLSRESKVPGKQEAKPAVTPTKPPQK